MDQLLGTSDRPAFQRMVARLFGPHSRALGWQPAPDEPPDRRELRAAILNALDLLAQDPAVAAEGLRRLAAWEANPNGLDPSLVPTVLSIGARHGDAARWEDYRARIGTAPTPEVRLRLEQALGQFRDPSLLKRSLELTLPPATPSADAFPAQDIGYLYVTLFANPAARSQAWTFLASHWVELSPRIPGYFLERMILPGVGQLCSAGEREQVAELFKAHPLESGNRMVQRVLENIDLCMKVHREQAPHAAEAVKAMTAALPAGT
jgi:aminopeptidase N